MGARVVAVVEHKQTNKHYVHNVQILERGFADGAAWSQVLEVKFVVV